MLLALVQPGRNLSPMPIVILLVAVYLLLVFVLPLTLSAAVTYRSLPVGRGCPHCAGETIRVRARHLEIASAITPSRLDCRFCLVCGWEGTVRLARTPVTLGPAVRARSASADAQVAADGGSRTIDVRWLTVDGIPWRVQLECWRQTGLYYGRLVFVEPSGRHWMDMQPFAGRSDRDVLGQALSLPDRLLASRLRELVND
jgi:hypothetical protein